MKKSFVLTFAVLIMSTLLAGQGKPAEPLTRKGLKSVYVEVLGNGLFLTLNYEKLLTDKLGFRVGGLVVPIEGKLSGVGTIMGTAVWGDGNFCMEAGLGVMTIMGEYISIATDDVNSIMLAVTGTIGVRYQPKGKGIVLRLGFTPIAAPGGVLPWAGAGIGYSFR